MFSVCFSVHMGDTPVSGPRSFLEGTPLVLSLFLSEVLFQVLPWGTIPRQDSGYPSPRRDGDTPTMDRRVNDAKLRVARLLR